MNHERKKFDAKNLIIALIAVALFFLFDRLSLTVPRRTLLIWELLLLSVALSYRLLSSKIQDHLQKDAAAILTSLSNALLFAMLISLLYTERDYSYANVNGFSFGWIALAITALCVAIWAFATRQKEEETKPIVRVLSLLAIAFFIFVGSNTILEHFNYILDRDPPKEYTATIEAKDYDSNHKSPDSYEFKFTADGETFYLDVRHSIYSQYNVGDEYTFYRYSGAFGKAFYLSDPTQKGGS